LALTINEFPGYVVANEGCYYWGWYVACDFQLYLIIPIFVYILEFKLPNWVAKIIIFALLAGGTAINYHILYKNNMAAGLFAP
jgi:hypothetical protein